MGLAFCRPSESSAKLNCEISTERSQRANLTFSFSDGRGEVFDEKKVEKLEWFCGGEGGQIVSNMEQAGHTCLTCHRSEDFTNLLPLPQGKARFWQKLRPEYICSVVTFSFPFLENAIDFLRPLESEYVPNVSLAYLVPFARFRQGWWVGEDSNSGCNLISARTWEFGQLELDLKVMGGVGEGPGELQIL